MRPSLLSVWPPLPPHVYARNPAPALPFPLGDPGCAVFARARHALWQGVQALRLEPGDEVLVPAYHHGSEVEALARAGLAPRFYEAHESLGPDESELEALLTPTVRALYLIHYLGFPQDVARWRTWCDERGLLLLEDAGQAWLAADDVGPVGSVGDLAIFCLYKTFGVPDGGALRVRGPVPGPETQRSRQLGGVVRRHALWALQRSYGLSRVAGLARDGDGYSPADDFALGDPGSAPSAATVLLLRRLADVEAAARRRANYEALLDALGDGVPPPCRTPSPGASPFAFPLETDAKARLLERLNKHGIAALDFWSEPHPSLPRRAFAGAAERRSRTICLPVHQELRPEDLDRLVEAARPPRKRARFSELSLEHTESLDAVRDEWRELALRSENIFSSFEWTDVWLRHFRPRGRLLVTVCRDRDERVVAILPLYEFPAGGLRVVRFLGVGPADELGPVCDPEDRPVARRALRRLLAELRPDLFLAEQVRADEGWPALLAGQSLRREGSPVLRFAGTNWEGVLASRSANLRQQVRRLERRLLREHDVRYRLADDRARLQADLDILFGLHAERWQAGESAFAGTQAAFHREFAQVAFERGWLRLWILEVDGAPVSAWYGFRFGGIESYYQAGRDPAWERASVGFVLLAHSIRAAVEDGMREYRFLRGSESFKYRFANADPGLETVGVARGGLAHAALAASSLLPSSLSSSLRYWFSGAARQRG